MQASAGHLMLPGEIELCVQSIERSNIEELGTTRWFQSHERLQRLNLQAAYEAGKLANEVVKEMFISCGKIPILVHEAICISVWREKVFPILLSINEEPTTTFLPYMVLYHEALAVALMETILYHEDSCECLENCVIDLIDYCMPKLAELVVFDTNEVDTVNEPCSSKDEVVLQSNKLKFDIGIRCISIIRYISEYLQCLPLSAAQKLYETHDVLLLLTELIVKRPWRKNKCGKFFVYENGKWEEEDATFKLKVIKPEGQTWIAIRQLLLGPSCLSYYQINDFRKEQLLKLQGYLHDALIDQIPPMLDLKYYINKLSITNVPPPRHFPLLEVIPEIRKAILESGTNKWEEIAQNQAKVLFKCDEAQVFEHAKRLVDTYNFDIVEALMPENYRCARCRDPASKKCSRCKEEWYCGRECQVKHWKKHKASCDLVFQVKEVKLDS